jgi:outer membrane protein TolC
MMLKYFSFPIFLLLLLPSGILAQKTTQNIGYFIKLGLVNSPLLKDYQNQINSASVDSILIKAAQKPRLDANAQLLVAPAYRNFGYDAAITNEGNYSGLIGINQNILNHKDLQNKYQSNNIQKRSITNSAKISGADLTRVITAQYMTTYADFIDDSLNESAMKLLENQKEILQRLVENGVYKQTDFLSLLIETQSQEISVKQSFNQYDKDYRLLRQICGLNDSIITKLSAPEITKKDLVDPTSSPLFIQYQFDSLKIINSKIAVDLRYRPKISWVADAGLLSASPSTLAKHFGFSAGINFSVPIYDGKQRKLEYEKLYFSENTRATYKNYSYRQYNQQVTQLNNDLAATLETAEQLKRQLNTSEELMKMVKALINTGNISITEFINDTKNYNNINRTLHQTQIKILLIINEINYLMQQ